MANHACAECNGADDHEALLDVEAELPSEMEADPDKWVEEDLELDDDQLFVDGELTHVRGVLPIPIRETSLLLRYAVWVAVPAGALATIRAAEKAGAGWELDGTLATDAPYGSSGHVARLAVAKPGERATVTLTVSKDRLFEDTQRGIDFFYLHFYRRRIGLETARNTAAQWPLRCTKRHDQWPHRVPACSGVFTSLDVAARGKPALQIAHTDGGLEAVAGTADPHDATYVCLACLISRDRSLVKLADLPLGFRAYRNSPLEPWVVERDTEGLN